jgi:hypothetical protein
MPWWGWLLLGWTLLALLLAPLLGAAARLIRRAERLDAVRRATEPSMDAEPTPRPALVRPRDPMPSSHPLATHRRPRRPG